MIQKCFQIDKRDNVATALHDLLVMDAIILGDKNRDVVMAIEPIKKGHKIALKKIKAGEKIIKYGVVIGRATKNIEEGQWIHLHNCESLYDERSTHLNLETGAPQDTQYD